MEPKRRKAQPLMTCIHGGPHSQVSTGFFPSLAAYALQGCMYDIHESVPSSSLLAELTSRSIDTLNIPNYTGSTGFGDFYIQELIGKCGTLDVQDVKACVDHLVGEGKAEHGPGKQFATGGSHGGFLTAHRELRPSP